MSRLSKRQLTCLRLSPIAIIVAFAACGNKDGGDPGGATSGGAATGGAGATTGSGGNGSGGGSGATSGSGGNAAGGNGSGAASGSGGGSGSGGASGTGGDGGGSSAEVPGADNYDCSAASGTIPALQATSVVTGLSQPIELAHEPGGAANRLFVLERAGVIKIIEDGSALGTPFLDFTDKAVAGMSNGDERGALGFAFHPNYQANGLFYVHYSDAADSNDSGDSVIEEYKVSSDANVADAASGRVVLTIEQPDNGIFKNHKGGGIHFGSDSMLYIGLGDGGGSDDPDGNGQDVTTLLGKILRIDPTGTTPGDYTSPAGNLVDSMSPALPEIWDYGLRNPFRSSFDGCTGDFYIADVGQNAWEEVNVEKRGEGGKNYGWNTMEGTHCFSPTTGCSEAGLTLPVLDYDRQAGQSITGGSVYRGSTIPALRGAYFYADYGSGGIWYTFYDRDAGTVSTPVSVRQDLNNVSQLVSIANGADGELYFVSLTGGVYKLESAE